MTVRIEKPAFNLRDKLSELDKPTGLKGSELMRSETSQEVRDLINSGRKNLIINGAMMIAQRGTSSTSAGYKTVDRFNTSMANVDEACTFEQANVAADTDPWNAGFRRSFKVTNGNQTSGAGAADDLSISQNIEAQNLANSGWDYTSSLSYITLSFWAKSSVAQTFYTGFRIYGSDQREYCFSYTLAANTWKKVTHAIPGGDGHTILNSNAIGAFIQWPMWWGTNYTSSGRVINSWQIKNNASNYPDNASTWYTTNDATFELTGVQLEVGPIATEFEHRSYAEELALCQRYFMRRFLLGNCSTGFSQSGGGYNSHLMNIPLPCKMRTQPTVTFENGTQSGCFQPGGDTANFGSFSMGPDFLSVTTGSTNSTWTTQVVASSAPKILINAEL